MRRAFDATMKDAKFLAEAERAHIYIDPLDGEAVARAIDNAYAQPKEVIVRAVELWPPAVPDKD